MIIRIEEIPITKESYPFASAERYCGLSERGYQEKEYYMYGNANIYQTLEDGSIGIKNKDVSYTNRFIVRAPSDIEKFSGNVVAEIINPTSFMEIDRMWILGWREFVRRGDIYVGITSKPNTIPKMLEFNSDRYGGLSWPNPTPEIPFPFHEQDLKKTRTLRDQDIHVEMGLFWDMLSDLAVKLREETEDNPLSAYKLENLVLTGWSQSAGYLIRYVNDFVYREERESELFDGFLAAGPPRYLNIPVNQYESANPCDMQKTVIKCVKQPTIVLQTESENGHLGTSSIRRREGEASEFLCRQYDVTGASHDTVYSYVDYYQNDPDLIRIHHLPKYVGKDAVPNNYPTQLLAAAAFRNLFQWINTGIAPARCGLIQMDYQGENVKDALGISKGGLRTCLLDYPTGSYYCTSEIERGMSDIFPESDKELLFGHEEPFPKEMLRQMYGTLDHYRKLVTEHTRVQTAKGFIVKEDMEDLIEMAVELAKERGLE